MSVLGNVSDDAWSVLLDEDHLTQQRRVAEDKYKDFTGSQIKKMRILCKSDLYFLANGALEYDLLSQDFHGHYTQWLRSTWGERYRMTLFARDHYKSTINTIADSIQMSLPNVDGLIDAWPYSLGPNVKILLAHENRESASRFLYEITRAFLDKPLMLALFPDLIPSSRIQRMNKWELELPRTAHHKEPTFDTIGAGGAAQGRHYNWLKLDDLVGEAARDSETVMKTTLLWFDNVLSLLTRMKIDGWDLIGTRWAPTDIYSHALKMYGADTSKSILRAYDQRDIDVMEDGQLVIYARGAVEDGKPVFPEEFAMADLMRIRKRPEIWAAQYANNPRSGGLTRLKPEWLKYYNIGSQDKLVVFGGEERGSFNVRTSELDRLIMIDPSMGEKSSSDPTGFIVTGTDSKMNIYILEAFRLRLKPPDLIDEMFRLYQKWNPRLISIEGVAFSSMIKYWFDIKCQESGVYPSIYDYKPGNKRSKIGRIEGLANYAAGGQLYILEGMTEFRDEWEWFPLGEDDHLLDALAQGPEIWAPSVVEEGRDMRSAIQLVEDSRDILTGYSVI